MAEKKGSIQPLFLNMDTAYDKMPHTDAPFIKDLTWDINRNADVGTGTSNASQEGQNLLVLTPAKSNYVLPDAVTPAGFNKKCGGGECIITSEYYYFNYNSEGNHGIYIISGNELKWYQLIIDKELSFSDDQEAFIQEHRIHLRIIKNTLGEIIEKILFWTDGNKWQGWINVVACLSTEGFNVEKFPYWSLQPPHFDRRELLEYAVRPPMTCPQVTPIANVDADRGKNNFMLDTAFEFCIQDVYTDGRETTVSPYSTPYYISTEEYLTNPDLLSKRALLTFVAGSCMAERKNIYMRLTKKEQGTSPLDTFSQWYLYDTIYKYNSEGNTNSVLGTAYWNRENPWAKYSYDSTLNTIQYIFDNSKVGQIVDQNLFTRIQTALPQLSRAATDLGDAALFCNNRNGYDNFSDSLLDKLSAEYVARTSDSCPIPTRKVRLYAMATRGGNDDTYISQPGYFLATDTQFRFGGVDANPSGDLAVVNPDESKYFGLDFSDKMAFRCYAKGTPYYADGVLYTYDNNNILSKVTTVMDLSLDSVKAYVQMVYIAGGNFVWMFEFELPAGVYDFALGRHSVASSGDYRNLSTYVRGIANSKNKTNVFSGKIFSVLPTAVVDDSKEYKVDCAAGDVDVWGNGADVFYIFAPFSAAQFSVIEGYFKESPTNPVGVELFPYAINIGSDNSGKLTDKNGFYYAMNRQSNADDSIIEFTCKINCTYPTVFQIATAGTGFGWFKNGDAYLSDQNSGSVGFANYILYKISIKDLTGTIGYSNIGISIKDGQTVYTDQNGNATLRIHNGQSTLRTSEVYINAGGNFNLSDSNCGVLQWQNYSEANSTSCQTTSERSYNFPLNLQVKVQGSTQRSVKSNSTKIVSMVGADLAGRVTYVNSFAQVNIPSFDERNSISPTYLRWLLNGSLNLDAEESTRDIKWLAIYVSQSTNYVKTPLQWVGDKIDFVDSAGNVTSTPSNASLVKITISSLLEANIKSNYTLFANYQFVIGDKMRIFDDGDGQLFDTATYGEMIDVIIQGSSYNTAAINANLIQPTTNTVITNTGTTTPSATEFFVKYDSRFDKLYGKTGFWIELYTPSQNNEKLPYFETDGFFPIINGEMAVYKGGGITTPSYDYPTSGDIVFWDTYMLRRNINIPGIGNKYFNHPFESPNITDTWGANAISGGRQNTVNPDAKQLWYEDETRRSDNFISNGIKNGLGTFRSENIDSFKGTRRGGITAVSCQFSVILFICEYNWFVTDYNYKYIYANAQGVSVANLSDNMGDPHQKVGYDFGCSYKDTQTVLIHDKYIFWYDRKNGGYIMSNYSVAKDITRIKQDKTGMIQSYFTAKSEFITSWNQVHGNKDLIDVVCGIDIQLNEVYVTFRPRRGNTYKPSSFVNTRREVDLKHQETFVYNIDLDRWVRMAGAAPEGYGKLRGNSSGKQLLAFASGIPYYFAKGESSFSTFFGQQVQPCFTGVLSGQENITETLKCITENINGPTFFVDKVYGTDKNAFATAPLSAFKEKEQNSYGAVLRNMVTYPPVDPKQAFRSMAFDGKRLWGNYFVCRFVLGWENIGKYFQINKIDFEFFDKETPQK